MNLCEALKLVAVAAALKQLESAVKILPVSARCMHDLHTLKYSCPFINSGSSDCYNQTPASACALLSSSLYSLSSRTNQNASVRSPEERYDSVHRAAEPSLQATVKIPAEEPRPCAVVRNQVTCPTLTRLQMN